MSLGCATCIARPTIVDVAELLAKFDRCVDADLVRIQTADKDVLEQQALITDGDLRGMESVLRDGFTLDRGRALLLIEEVKRLRLELADFEMLVDHTTHIYSEING